MIPVLPVDATEAQLHHLLVDGAWAMLQKVDGHRLAVEYDGRLRFHNRSGAPASLPRRVERALRADLPQGEHHYGLDGELVVDKRGRPTLWVFDGLYVGTFDERYAAAAAAVAGDIAHMLPVAHTIDEKWDLFRTLQETGGEGVVFRRRDAQYMGGKSTDALRWKFVKTVDAVVFDAAPKGDRACVSVGTFDDEYALHHVGDVSVHGRGEVPVGTVLELAALYASEDLRLVQPRIVRVRTDKEAIECSLDQVRAIVTDPTVHATLPQFSAR